MNTVLSRSPALPDWVTLEELVELADTVDLVVDDVVAGSCSRSTGRLDRACRSVSGWLGDQLQEGFTVTYRVRW